MNMYSDENRNSNKGLTFMLSLDESKENIYFYTNTKQSNASASACFSSEHSTQIWSKSNWE